MLAMPGACCSTQTRAVQWLNKGLIQGKRTLVSASQRMKKYYCRYNIGCFFNSPRGGLIMVPYTQRPIMEVN